ncbi:hypothetical protein STEG23_028887, partial [Scotinomys teguina]
ACVCLSLATTGDVPRSKLMGLDGGGADRKEIRVPQTHWLKKEKVSNKIKCDLKEREALTSTAVDCQGQLHCCRARNHPGTLYPLNLGFSIWSDWFVATAERPSTGLKLITHQIGNVADRSHVTKAGLELLILLDPPPQHLDYKVDSTSSELDVKRAFAKWRWNHNHIWQVLMYTRRVLYKIDTTSPLNPEAAVLYEKDIQLFKSIVVDSVNICTARLSDQPKMEDPYAISFSPWNPSVHGEEREMLTQEKSLTNSTPISALLSVATCSTAYR